MQFRFFLPSGYDPSEEYPLLLFLHGAGESGADNVFHVQRHIESIIEKTESEYPAILVAPQLPTSSGWRPSNPLDETAGLLDIFINNLAVDEDRLYITGLSMGGFGTMRWLEHYNVNNPEILRFAAAAPTAGAIVSDEAVQALRDTPIWISHSNTDTVVSVDFANQTYNALIGNSRNAPISFPPGSTTTEFGNTRYTRYANGTNGNHDSWVRFYGNDEFYDWMFSQSLTSAVPEPSSAVILALAFSLAWPRAQNPRRRMC